MIGLLIIACLSGVAAFHSINGLEAHANFNRSSASTILQPRSVSSFKLTSFQQVLSFEGKERPITHLIGHAEPITSEPKTSTMDLLKFGFPTLCIWMLQPMLSLMDTSIVGLSPSTSIAELAALGPGCAYIDCTIYVFYFLAYATTSLYAGALSEKNEKKAEQVLSRSILTAFVFGLIVFVAQSVFAKAAVTSLSGTSTESIPYAMVYARIRACAAPVALPTIVAEAAFLAVKDPITPLKVCALGAAFNFLGDLLLVKGFNMGSAGAAMATVASQYVGAMYLLYITVNKLRKRYLSESPPSSPSSTTSLLQLLKEKIYWPSIPDMLGYLQFCGSLFMILFIQTCLWSYTTYACSASGAIQLAAHLISIDFFLFFCNFGSVLSQIGQSYLPYYIITNDGKRDDKNGSGGDGDGEGGGSGSGSKSTESPEDQYQSIKLNSAQREAAMPLIKRILKLAFMVGIGNAFAIQLLKYYGAQMFTKSKEIRVTMQSVSNLLSYSLLTHCVVMAMEGTLTAFRDFKFLSTMYAFVGAFFLCYQTLVRFASFSTGSDDSAAASSSNNNNVLTPLTSFLADKGLGGIRGVWFGTTMYQYLRAVLFGSRLWHLLREKS